MFRLSVLLRSRHPQNICQVSSASTVLSRRLHIKKQTQSPLLARPRPRPTKLPAAASARPYFRWRQGVRGDEKDVGWWAPLDAAVGSVSVTGARRRRRTSRVPRASVKGGRGESGRAGRGAEGAPAGAWLLGACRNGERRVPKAGDAPPPPGGREAELRGAPSCRRLALTLPEWTGRKETRALKAQGRINYKYFFLHLSFFWGFPGGSDG